MAQMAKTVLAKWSPHRISPSSSNVVSRSHKIFDDVVQLLASLSDCPVEAEIGQFMKQMSATTKEARRSMSCWSCYDTKRKSGGPPRALAIMTKFRRTMTSCGLSDMGFVGSRFTWLSKHTRKRLDRGFQCVQWRSRFPFSRVITLNPSESDHCPLLIEAFCERQVRKRINKPFRFEECWYGREECLNIIQQQWSTPTTGNALQQIENKTKAVGDKLRLWHRMDFNQQQTEMRIVKEKLNDLMRQQHSVQLYEEQRLLHVHYSQLLSFQETYWRQRSRALWLKEGDRNTTFFHRKASNRRSRNLIKGLLDDHGIWQTEPQEIQAILLQYFQTIFSAEQVDEEAIVVVTAATPCRVTLQMNDALLAPYTNEEIKMALFQMHPSKSPGPDGMSPFFYQKYWTVVCEDVCLAVKNLLELVDMWPNSNHTYLCLISKIQDPKEAMHFRPIALCNVICRISSKVVPNRLKMWLPDIVSPLQSAYVPSRLISDNTLVANEAAHFMHKLSEGLSALISHAVQHQVIQGLKMCPQAPTLHHLFFADDSVLFGSATMEECMHYKRILDIYEKASGQKVNFQKSSVVFSNNVNEVTQQELVAILNIQCLKEHDKYLGLPMKVGRSKSAIFAYIKEKLAKKLVNWKAKILSAAGKEILIKAVAQTMPLYAMNCYLLPKSLCDDIHQLCASFFWGDTYDKKKIHWRSWERLCLTKDEGGMGFKNMFAYNLAMLAKQGWRLLSNPNSLIARLYKARYYPNNSFWEAELGDSPSFSWRSILQGRPVLKAGVQWCIGDGTQVNIWNDRWILDCQQYLIHKPSDCVFELVSDLIDHGTRTWMSAAVYTIFPPGIAQKVVCIPLGSRNMVDKLCWRPEKKGFFSVKTAYWIARTNVLANSLASTSHGNTYHALWKRMWKANVLGKVKICIWRACSDLLPTRAKLFTKGYRGDLRCLLCSHFVEDIAHVLCKCPTTVEILTATPFHLESSLLPNIDFKELMLDHALHLKQEVFDKLLMVLWALW
ncbi:uncharacterized protein LOC112170934 [Rosa chinensis]|uniref:uncharacterized protein LOC112170934 n=1 Tax=Rosa chinensis TaxID=74649 RepID=UPI000D08C568|nr:uncharacterized protein LOC112170934 [Rosa chinensis]